MAGQPTEPEPPRLGLKRTAAEYARSGNASPQGHCTCTSDCSSSSGIAMNSSRLPLLYVMPHLAPFGSVAFFLSVADRGCVPFKEGRVNSAFCPQHAADGARLRAEQEANLTGDEVLRTSKIDAASWHEARAKKNQPCPVHSHRKAERSVSRVGFELEAQQPHQLPRVHHTAICDAQHGMRFFHLPVTSKALRSARTSDSSSMVLRGFSRASCESRSAACSGPGCATSRRRV